ncbi:helix-turn-helix transcriptional regulator [Herbaspirillum sp. GCM10030257]|uniref:helix-turn-helix transcriptional regulator n=1 Tax=Herbaspirillum sp. GCM10030257 TaxID=3273393 RepID=UPI00361BE8D9
MAQDFILRLPDVIARTGLRKSSIYNAIKAGQFPSHVSLGLRAVGWRSSEIDAWIESRTAMVRK